MNSKHTPGPWHCKTMGPKFGGWSVGITRHIEEGKSCDAMTGKDLPAHDVDCRIARVSDGCTGEEGHATAEANARLIAAAPDLLAACVKMVRFQTDGGFRAELCRRRENESAVWGKILDDAKAAIAKAEGNL